MQIQFDNIGSGERLLCKIGEEEFVVDARTRDAHRALLFGGWMRGHHHPTQYPRRSHWDLWAIIETARRLTFWTLLKLIGRQMQTRLYRADDREQYIPCRGSRRRSQSHRRARPRSHIVRRVEAGRAPVEADAR